MKRTCSAVDEAIEWMACMRSGEVLADEQKAFDAWFANPSNAQAWEKVQGHLGATFSPLYAARTHKYAECCKPPTCSDGACCVARWYSAAWASVWRWWVGRAHC